MLFKDSGYPLNDGVVSCLVLALRRRRVSIITFYNIFINS